MLATKAASLARGHSGVRPEVIDMLVRVHNAGLVPFVPSQGSVGASGDLAPLSHMTLALLGEGEMLVGGKRVPAAPVLAEHGITPLALEAKEGLALINGTQTSASLALHAFLAFEPVLESALVVGALTVDAARGSDGPFDPRIHALRGQPGQIDVAQYYRALLAGSEIRRSHLQGDDRVQDPYCLRCQPQVVGACLDQLRHAAGWSQEEFAAQCGLHRTYIGAIERGEKAITITTADKLAQALGMTLAQLFTELEAEADLRDDRQDKRKYHVHRCRKPIATIPQTQRRLLAVLA